MNVLVTGASGFVGSHVVDALLAEGHTVVGLSRSAPKGDRRKAGATYYNGVNVAEASTLIPSYFNGIEAVVHLVGIIAERRPAQTFQRIHVDGTRNLVNVSKQSGVRRFIYLSAIGSAPEAEADYSRTKFEAETLVKASGVPYIVIRPSIILGKDGEFVAQMRDLVKHGGLPVKLPFPFIPIPGGGKNKFQPIYVDDLMTCISRSLTDNALTDCTIQVGGASQVTFNEIIDTFAAAEHIHKPRLHAPIPILNLVAPLVEMLPNPPFNRDQLKNLKRDNITDIRPMQQAFHFEPIGFQQTMDKIYES